MKCYRIKHLPTDMYFTPSREVQYKLDGEDTRVKSNLSDTGKVYTRKPNLRYVGGWVYSHIHERSLNETHHKKNPGFPFIEEEWAIEEV